MISVSCTIRRTLLTVLFVVLARVLCGFQVTLQREKELCFFTDLKEHERFLLVYDISDMENFPGTLITLGLTFRSVDGLVVPSIEEKIETNSGSGNYTYIAQQEGRYDYCFIGSQGNFPSSRLNFYAVSTPSLEETSVLDDSSSTDEDDQYLMEDLQQLLYSTLSVKLEQKILLLREEKHQKSKQTKL